VKTSAADLARLNSVTRETYDAAVAAHAAFEQARALSAQLEKLSGAGVAQFKAQVDSLAPASAAVRRRPGFGGGGGGAPLNLETASNAMMAAAMAMQGADVAPTTGQVATAGKARADAVPLMRGWTALKTSGLASFNAMRKASNQPEVPVP
jgi:hypothetical protein